MTVGRKILKVLPANYKGDSGKEIELGKSLTHLLWRYRERIEKVSVDFIWRELIPLSEIGGGKGNSYFPSGW